MRKFVVISMVLSMAVCLATPDTAEARIFGRRRGGGGGGSSYSGIPSGHTNSTAQGVANIMATLGYVGHFGGNPGYEGCGSGGSAAAAYGNCCFANSGMNTWDYGIAQGSNGMFYCCRRYGSMPASVAAARAAAAAAAATAAAEAPAAPVATAATEATAVEAPAAPTGGGNDGQ